MRMFQLLWRKLEMMHFCMKKPQKIDFWATNSCQHPSCKHGNQRVNFPYHQHLTKQKKNTRFGSTSFWNTPILWGVIFFHPPKRHGTPVLDYPWCHHQSCRLSNRAGPKASRVFSRRLLGYSRIKWRPADTIAGGNLLTHSNICIGYSPTWMLVFEW